MKRGLPRNKQVQELADAAGIQYHTAYVRYWRVRTKAKRTKRAADRRRSAIKTKYGITVEEYDYMLVSQEGRCAICKEKRKLVLDHNHVTKQNRKFVCTPCNLMIGHAKDQPHILLAAVDYLNHHAESYENKQQFGL